VKNKVCFIENVEFAFFTKNIKNETQKKQDNHPQESPKKIDESSTRMDVDTKKQKKKEGWKGYSPLKQNADDVGKSWIRKDIEAY
jgi:hypothetical protein